MSGDFSEEQRRVPSFPEYQTIVANPETYDGVGNQGRVTIELDSREDLQLFGVILKDGRAVAGIAKIVTPLPELPSRQRFCMIDFKEIDDPVTGVELGFFRNRTEDILLFGFRDKRHCYPFLFSRASTEPVISNMAPDSHGNTPGSGLWRIWFDNYEQIHRAVTQEINAVEMSLDDVLVNELPRQYLAKG